jgi:eukaryotic-like serine/threonine-protein kinase
MEPERWKQIEALCQGALEQKETERIAFLERACAGDQALRRDVEFLLSHQTQAENFLETPAVQLMIKELAEEKGAKSLPESPALNLIAKQMGQDATRSLAGQRLGSYQIVSLLGAGGMGEVYRARDTKLQRDVAIKVLPKAFVDDPDRIGRFRREAQMLASLNHPNIATIHGLEQSDSVHYLAMELVPGETLAQRIERAGALPISEALSVSRQIAEALEAAHEKGVIHRDLKPANVKVTPEGRVKVLDFGLAKAFAGDGSASNSIRPTATEAGTEPGVVLGTPSYMSPEQARGKPVDKRTDIWAFGCVLFELLTGRQAFRGETSADSIAAVVEREPDWKALPPTVPAGIRRLLQRCLQKDVNRRLRDIGDARIEIEEPVASPETGELAVDPGMRAHARWRRVTRLGVIFFAAAAVAAVAVWGLRVMTLPAPQPISRFTVTLPPDRPLALVPPSVAISPDGTHLVYAAIRGGTSQLYLRPLDQMQATPIEGAEDGTFPFFSPDGQWLGFFADGKLKKTPISGGPSVVLCDTAGGRGGSWGENGTIIFAPEARGGLYLISAAGGPPQVLATPDSNKGETSYRSPSFLPGGNEVLFTVLGTTRTDVHIVVQSLKTGERRVLTRGGDAKDHAHYVPTGYLVYSHNGTLLAAPFDTRRLELTGTPVPVVEDIAKDISGQFSFSCARRCKRTLVLPV